MDAIQYDSNGVAWWQDEYDGTWYFSDDGDSWWQYVELPQSNVLTDPNFYLGALADVGTSLVDDAKKYLGWAGAVAPLIIPFL